MKDLVSLLVTYLSVVLALVVVWIYARETFEWVALFLALYTVWVTTRWILRRRGARKGNSSNGTSIRSEPVDSMHRHLLDEG